MRISTFWYRGVRCPVICLAALSLVLAACGEQRLSQLPPWLQSPKPPPEQVNEPPAPQDQPAPPPPPLKPDVPRIAILLPLSGPSAKIGQDMLSAAQMALFHFADQHFELLPHDTRGTPEGAADAMALAVGDGASLILGPLLSRSVAAVAPVARAAGVPVIAFTSDRTVTGDGVYTMGFLPSEEVARIVRYAGERGVRRIAVLAPDNDYGLRVVEEVGRVASRGSGVEMTDVAYYSPQTTNFDPVIRRLANYDSRRQALLDQIAVLKKRKDEVAERALKRLENLQTMGDVPFDGLLIPEGGKKLQAIAALLPYYDLDPKKIRMLGTGQWDVPGLGAEPALVGGWFAAPSPDQRAEFVEQFSAVYGEAPHRLATLAYDATALAAVLARDKSIDPADITSPRGFSGRDGIFRFLADGTAERRLSVLRVEERTMEVIDPAPESFTGAIN